MKTLDELKLELKRLKYLEDKLNKSIDGLYSNSVGDYFCGGMVGFKKGASKDNFERGISRYNFISRDISEVKSSIKDVETKIKMIEVKNNSLKVEGCVVGGIYLMSASGSICKILKINKSTVRVYYFVSKTQETINPNWLKPTNMNEDRVLELIKITENGK